LLDRERKLRSLKSRAEKISRVVLIFAFTLLASTAFYLQIIKGDYYYFLSEKNRSRTYIIFASRGKIYDRDGNVLATNQPTFDLYIVPFYVQVCKKALHSLLPKEASFKFPHKRAQAGGSTEAEGQ